MQVWGDTGSILANNYVWGKTGVCIQLKMHCFVYSNTHKA